MPEGTRTSIALTLLAVLSLAGCESFGRGVTQAVLEGTSEPGEDTRACEVEGRPFVGIEPFLAAQDALPPFEEGDTDRPEVKVLYVHGIGTHAPGHGTALRQNLATSLGLETRAPRPKRIVIAHPEFPDQDLGEINVTRLADADRRRDLLFYELTWSPITLVIDGTFSEFDAGDFDHFTASGVSIIAQNTGDTLFDGTALEFNGSGAATLEQILSDRSTPPPGGVLMALGLHRKVVSLSAGSITLRLVVDGSPLAGTIVIDTSTPTGSWGHEAVFVYVPRLAFPDELKLEILSDASFNGDVLIDGVSVGLADSIGHGLSLAIFQGVEPFVRIPVADRFSFGTTSDEAGVLSRFFRDVYGIELPASAAPTIADSLAI